MKIAHVSAHYRPIVGGQEVYISNLIEVCRRKMHVSKVFQLNRGEKADDAVCLPRLPYFARIFPSFDRKWLNYMVSLLKPRELFESDVIISHYAFHAPPLERIRHKTIILSHGVEWRVEKMDANDMACEANARNCLGRYVHVVNDTHYLRRMGYEVEPAKDFFAEPVPGAWFIPNCVDTDQFVPGPGLSEYVGKEMILVPRKIAECRGIHLAIEAFSKVAPEFPNLEMCLLGKRFDAANPYIRRLDEMIHSFGLEEKVYFRDPVSNGEMPLWFNSAKITIIPTLEREGTSLSALESMSCGVATISTNVAGLADLPTMQCGPNPDALAGALRTALEDAAEIGEKQRKIVNEVFNMKNWSEAWLKVIERVSSKGAKLDG